MRALMITQEALRLIGALREQAADHPIDAMKALSMSPEAARAANIAQTILIEHGFTVTFTVERQPSGLFRHISISIDQPRKLPAPNAVNALLSLFNMHHIDKASMVWLERTGEIDAINVLDHIRESENAGTKQD